MSGSLAAFRPIDAGPAEYAEAVTLTSDYTPTGFSAQGGPTLPRAFYVGSSGNVKVDTVTGQTVTLANVPTGALIQLRVKKVYSTANGTTASSIVLLY